MRLNACITQGSYLAKQGKIDDAIKHYLDSLISYPNDNRILWRLNLLQLLKGEYQHWPTHLGDGWYKLSLPLWPGTKAHKVLVTHSQGAGDFFQFCRYLNLMDNVDEIVIETGYPIDKWMHNDKIRGKEDGEVFEFEVPIMYLPVYYGIKDSHFYSPEKYLYAQDNKFKELVTSFPGPRIGIAGRGSLKHHENLARALPDTYASDLLIDGASCFSIQPNIFHDKLINTGHLMKDWSDTLELLDELDLIISADTGVAHMAAAMGKPTWLIISGTNPDWRWGLEGEVTSWYPTMKLYRRNVPWDIVCSQIKRDSQLAVPFNTKS